MLKLVIVPKFPAARTWPGGQNRRASMTLCDLIEAFERVFLSPLIASIAGRTVAHTQTIKACVCAYHVDTIIFHKGASALGARGRISRGGFDGEHYIFITITTIETFSMKLAAASARILSLCGNSPAIFYQLSVHQNRLCGASAIRALRHFSISPIHLYFLPSALRGYQRSKP